MSIAGDEEPVPVTRDTELRPNLTPAEAIDLLWVLHGPELFHR